jgi:hypothetical protein
MRTSACPVLLLALAAVLAACKPDTPTPAPAAQAPAPAAPAAPAAPPAAAAPQAVFRREELDQMVAPIALYPDELLAQVLMAATYPGDVADAAAWSKANANTKGDDAVRQVASQPWDPSVQSLVAFPQALALLGQDPAWVQRLGDAFLAQPGDVMDAVQRLRHQAQLAGNLKTNEYMQVSTQPAPAGTTTEYAPEPAVSGGGGGTTVVESAPQTIIIESADPEVVYVPSYNPTEVYGDWAYPSYPPTYYPPMASWYPGQALWTGLAFGTGIAIADSLWGDVDWGGDDIDIDVDRYNNINTNRQIDRSQNNWNHNAVNRDGVPYRDNANRERHGRQLDDSARRDSYRGDDPARAQQRAQARQSMQQRGISPATSNMQARDQAQRATREMSQQQARDRQRDQAAQATRERSQANERARAEQVTRDRQQAQQRDRQQAQQRDREQAQQRDRQQAQQRDRQQAQQRQRSQSNTQARDSARREQSRSQQTHNNAFAGSREPSRSHAQADRGRSSHASAQRSQASRGGGGGGGGRQVSRQSSPPQRQGGGARR